MARLFGWLTDFNEKISRFRNDKNKCFTIFYMKLKSLLFAIILSSFGLAQTQEPFSYTVEYYGALKNMMHKGDLSAKANLADFANRKHLYAIGALENLKGEIQIWDSHPLNSSVADSTLVLDETYNKNAALLVCASVAEWTSFNIPDSVKTYTQAEEFIAFSAQNHGLNVTRPFPFLIEGITDSVNWHVINWKDGDTEHSHEKHKNSGLNGIVEDSFVYMLGFYSNAHHAIFTHHTTNMHLHVITKNKSIAGHVDNLVLGKNMILKLPKIEE